MRPVSYGSELVDNSDFATDSVWNKGTGWSISGGVGSHVGPTGGQIVQNVSTTVGAIYLISYEITATDATVSLRWDGSAFNYPTAAGTYTFVKVATASSTEIGVYASTATSIDNISVKEVSFDESDGTLTLFEHPDNIPRVEYDASSGNRLGLLVEESRTNLVTYSEDFSGWTNVNAPLTPNAVEAPDGTITATKLIADATNNQHRRDYVSTYSAGTHTFSVFAKAGEYNFLELRLAGDGVYVDIRDGSLAGASAGITTHYQDVGNGWKRIAITHSTGANDTARINVIETSGTRTFVGDGTSGIYIWGAQLEEGSFPTSYIKTTGSTATRSADVASIPVADFGYNQSAGSIVIESQTFDITDVGRNFSLSDGTSSNVIRSQSQATNHLIVINSGSVTANLDAGAYSNNVFSKLGGAFAKDDIAASMDGGAVVTDTSSSIPAVTKLNIGGRYDGGLPLNGHIKSIKYYPRRLTNAQLQDLTS